MGRVTGACAFLITMLLFIQFKKEFSYEGGVAVFTVLSTGGNCTATLSGNYNPGVSLDQSNTAQLQIDVTNLGKFSLQTNSAGGMHFSTSGSLSDTGIQTIILAATGTPAGVGDFIFTPELTPSCSFIVTVTEKQETHADYTLSGAPNTCNIPKISGEYLSGTTMSSSNFVILNVDVEGLGDYTIHTDTLNGISFSAAGSFTKTGNQTVTLAASGRPDNAGHLVFTPMGNNGSGCAFDITIQQSGPPATYVIVSGQNLCVGNAAGVYTPGSPMTAANTYSMQVFVKNLGNFTIATQTVNGVYFYYSGEFTKLDDQYVTLQGYGTPNSIGDFILTPQIIGPAPLGGDVCDFTLTVK